MVSERTMSASSTLSSRQQHSIGHNCLSLRKKRELRGGSYADSQTSPPPPSPVCQGASNHKSPYPAAREASFFLPDNTNGQGGKKKSEGGKSREEKGHVQMHLGKSWVRVLEEIASSFGEYEKQTLLSVQKNTRTLHYSALVRHY